MGESMVSESEIKSTKSVPDGALFYCNGVLALISGGRCVQYVKKVI